MLKSSPQANTIGAALSRSARKNATSIALKFQDRQWTYKALDLAVNKIANQFLKQGLQPGDRVVAYGKNSDAYVLAWLAISRAGLVHVPTNFALNAEELRYVIQQSGARALISDISLAATVEQAVQGLGHPLPSRLAVRFQDPSTPVRKETSMPPNIRDCGEPGRSIRMMRASAAGVTVGKLLLPFTPAQTLFMWTVEKLKT